MVITQGIPQVLQAIIESKHKVVGIVDCAPANEPNKFLKAAGRFLTSIHYSLTSNPVSLKLFSRKMQIPYYYLRKGDSKDLEKWVRRVEPDLIVVFSMSHLLKENIFNIPLYGTVNIHYSYLPEYRGPNPLFWEYYDYRLDLGVTLHYVDKGEDTGDIICQERVFISPGEKLEATGQKLAYAGIKLLSETMKALENGSVGLKKQPISAPTPRARKIKPEEYNKLIKWEDWGVERVFHFLNGTPKYHPTLLKKSSLYRLVFSVRILDYKKCSTSGYKVGNLYKEKSGYFLACRDGIIHVEMKPSLDNFFAMIYPLIS
ncbi:methionyl-tRNA formyltransferase [Methanosarcina sp. T3]|uniref:methionyl-tRNA formyltransferase n=1 Tax=Methanosarcina sp. T3 TaxID=3439062 RepID=UPI003F8424D2